LTNIKSSDIGGRGVWLYASTPLQVSELSALFLLALALAGFVA
jgi:hypothetical protein